MTHVSLQDLRRVADALKKLHAGTVAHAAMRSDLRQLRIEMADGLLAVIGVDLGDDGQPRLEIDVIRPAAAPTAQLEVRFESA